MFDAVSLGEVMLRLDPGEGRIRTARSFRAWEGGGEYNVVRGLRRCFELHLRGITLSIPAACLYLFVRNGESIEGFPLGDVPFSGLLWLPRRMLQPIQEF